MTIIRATFATIALAALCGIAYVAYLVLGPDLSRTATALLLFGMWSLACVHAGQRLGAGYSRPALPGLGDPIKMFNWLRTGET
ncbi:MAG: hypothetical protein Q8P61_00935, partial [Candidatus Nanopelagicales bacterium]|nr:hypothetical protein [Candidatus Nanopelagicales bacterium]